MYEYRIVEQHGKGKAFSNQFFYDYDSCYYELLELINYRKTCVNNKYYKRKRNRNE